MSTASRQYKRPESVLVVVHGTDGMILLLKRADIEDFWQSVTGSLHWQERPREAARREVGEETGIVDTERLVDWERTARFEILGQFRARYAPDTHYNLEHMFSLEVDADHPIVIDPSEHECFAWIPYAEALDRVWSWSNRDAIRAVAQKYWPQK